MEVSYAAEAARKMEENKHYKKKRDGMEYRLYK